MADSVTIAGSPSSSSRSTAALGFIHNILEDRGLTVEAVSICDLDPHDLLYANFNSPSLKASLEKIARARAVIVATPIYKAAYSGALKVYLGLLPSNALCDKIVLPLATGGTLAHLLALDYTLKPVLAALGGRHVLQGIYLVDAQITHVPGQPITFAEEAEGRLVASLEELTLHLLKDTAAVS